MTLEAALNSLDETRVFANGKIIVRFRLGPVPMELVSNVHAVPFLEDGSCVLVRSSEWSWMIPGGTCEPGETPLETVVRELREEAGAALSSYMPIGAHWGESSMEPYRPHLPHPKFCMLLGWADAKLVAEPVPVTDGETIEEVGVFSVADAIEVLLSADKPDEAALIHLAAQHRDHTRSIVTHVTDDSRDATPS